MASSSSSLVLNISFTFFLIFILSSLPTNHAKANVTVFIEEVLEGHNTVRQTVGVPPLVYEPMLARVARVYANERRHDCNVVNSPWKAFGETVYTAPGKNWTVKDAIASWASEEQWYNATSNTCAEGKDCTDYTQMVWRTTVRIGCARVVCDKGDAYIACEYYPPGNYIGARPY